MAALARPGRHRLGGGHRPRALAREADLSANPHAQRGVAREDWARKAFEERHGTLLLPLCGESEEHPVLRASFDGKAVDTAWQQAASESFFF